MFIIAVTDATRKLEAKKRTVFYSLNHRETNSIVGEYLKNQRIVHAVGGLVLVRGRVVSILPVPAIVRVRKVSQPDIQDGYLPN